ncbi:hypothetical protein [Microscilla marina]|uniref:hypothetical protein n=1 Tax=Microscilla marina TaxID=1027 RepID=UPI0012F88F68|nr:hypothetical protein [Microscilla marina]
MEKIADIYSYNDYDTEELMHIQSIKKAKDWLLKTDKEKQDYRKSYLQMLTVHFQDEQDLEYIKQAVLVTDRILTFLQKATYYQNLSDNISSSEEPFYRIYNMLWCEKEYLLYFTSIRAIKVHVPIDLFKPLIIKIEDTKKYKEYELDRLFKEYNKMLSLFMSK